MIIGRVGKKTWKGRFFSLMIHAVLMLGAVTMIYPFLIMISGSVKSDVDFKEFNIIPRFLYADEVLFQKYLYSKYNGNQTLLFTNIKNPLPSVEKIKAPELLSPLAVADFRDFLENPPAELNDFYYGVGMVSEYGVYPLMLRKFRHWLKDSFGYSSKGLLAMNQKFDTEFQAWDTVTAPSENYFQRYSTFEYSGFLQSFREFKISKTDLMTRYYFDADGYFMEILRRDGGRTLSRLNEQYKTSFKSWEQIVLPSRQPTDNPELAAAWENFVRHELSLNYVQLLDGALPHYRKFLVKRYPNISAVNAAYGTDWKNFTEVSFPADAFHIVGTRRSDWNDFISETVPSEFITVVDTSFLYRKYLQKKYGTLEKLNAAHAQGYKSFEGVALPAQIPDYNISFQKDWLTFINTLSDESDVGLSRNSIFDYKDFVSDLYSAPPEKTVDYEQMSADYRRSIGTWEDVPAFRFYPKKDTLKAKIDYVHAIGNERFEKLRIIAHPSILSERWGRFLKNKYGTVDELNKAYGFVYTSWDSIPLPSRQFEWQIFQENKRFLLYEYLVRNYLMIVDTLFYSGNAAWNTIWYCFLSVLAALAVNPIAAYALSRYRPPSTYKLLLIMMLTMAFPPMVIGIPEFLIIKKLGLLNTFAALILPSVASGYSIFLLKSFFDSLPKELFESAQIDGASEWRMFIHIAVPLSKPVLAVTALGAFTAAYGNFMFAFILCQKKEMWTLMVYLYQLQQYSSPAVGFAALVVAAIPTLLIFSFCQNLIIKGIVVPSEK